MTAIAIASGHEAAGHLERRRCECAGMYEPVSSERSEVRRKPWRREAEVVEHVSVRCVVCGLVDTVDFVLSRDTEPVVPEGFEAPPDRREQHYLFAHRLLRERVFADPEGFGLIMDQPHADAWLSRLWTLAAERTPDAASPLPHDGLAADSAEIAGRQCTVITLPPPEAPVEAYAVVIAADRYFVLERMDDRRAVLCEWHADGGRTNHELVTGDRDRAPDPEEIVESVAEQLEFEQRAGAGYQPSSWTPGDDDAPSTASSTGGFRATPCVFAYDVLPRALSEQGAALASADDERRGAVLRELWEAARRRCPKDDALADGPLENALIDVEGDAWLVIALPDPLGPPEPVYVAIAVADANPPTCEPPVYTLELASRSRNEPLMVGRMDADGSHEIMGSLADTDLAAFLGVASGHLAPERGATMSQLLRYVELSAMLDADNGGK